ncbi:type II toxin-antitoxin system HicA family toxin (plasmid) [Entomospira entomophila]|uniref:Type II toxin-antitoxin system HicA family toxin n=1 Tax=Entomospira entomophila TaxID=2719988 RepID=A0A968GBX5_9SPIO|nr:type II toxin-antitoxin system HicA family toxin [Entomospira entomophilus]NIZ41545.1 type II toxin-antitoxin system HicA family toxin [Entomospira entomophilus]WDI36427.1 type II toxin-antitoxin system HicA family toxin [Entomospira entomophilus]
MKQTGKALLAEALRQGWVLERVNGSHHIIKKNNRIVSIPVHNKDLGKGIFLKLKKQIEENQQEG